MNEKIKTFVNEHVRAIAVILGVITYGGVFLGMCKWFLNAIYKCYKTAIRDGINESRI